MLSAGRGMKNKAAAAAEFLGAVIAAGGRQGEKGGSEQVVWMLGPWDWILG